MRKSFTIIHTNYIVYLCQVPVYKQTFMILCFGGRNWKGHEYIPQKVKNRIHHKFRVSQKFALFCDLYWKGT
jgi:hypothetical protein